MDFLNLPTALEVNGTAYDILSDFRDALGILTAFEDPDLSNAGECKVLCSQNIQKKLNLSEITPEI